MRVAQPIGLRGSLKWIQRAINEGAPSLQALLQERVPNLGDIDWRSPRAGDEHAEYRDRSFLKRIDRDDLAPALAAFWPARGPQWDALGVTGTGKVLLVEAKAHVGELCSTGTQAGEASRVRISTALTDVAFSIGAKTLAPWTDVFYQLANRISHRWFLRRQGADAWLLLIDFVGDSDVSGPSSSEAWDAAYSMANYVLGLPKRHALSRYIVHLRPTVA